MYKTMGLSQVPKHDQLRGRGGAFSDNNSKKNILLVSFSKNGTGRAISKTQSKKGNNMTNKIKMYCEGQPCRKCGTPVIKKIPYRKTRVPVRNYYKFYLFCPNCKTMYMLESEKVYV